MDSAYWQHISTGDRQAYTHVYTYYFKRLFNYGRKFTVDEALIEDVVQEVFTTLWIRRSTLHSVASPESYLFYSFRNALLAKIKQLQKKAQQEKAIAQEPDFNAESLIIRSEINASLHLKLEAALRALPSRQKEALFLRFYEGLSYEQVAEVMQISVHSSYKVVSKAVLKLREVMGLPAATIFILLRSLSVT